MAILCTSKVCSLERYHFAAHLIRGCVSHRRELIVCITLIVRWKYVLAGMSYGRDSNVSCWNVTISDEVMIRLLNASDAYEVINEHLYGPISR